MKERERNRKSERGRMKKREGERKRKSERVRMKERERETEIVR